MDHEAMEILIEKQVAGDALSSEEDASLRAHVLRGRAFGPERCGVGGSRSSSFWGSWCCSRLAL